MRFAFVFSLGFLFFLAGYIFAATCGDNICDAGQYLEGKGLNGVEDASTCYKDCAFTDYSICAVDRVNGGECNFGGIRYNIDRISMEGCSDSQVNNITVAFSGQGRSLNGFQPQKWVQLHDNVDILLPSQPCSAYLSVARLYLRRHLDASSLNNFVSAEKTVLNLKQDTKFELQYAFPLNISQPYCKTRLFYVTTGEEVTHTSTSGCQANPFKYDISGLTPGKYAVVSQYFDDLAENKMGEKTIGVTINGCSTDSECSDDKFYTKDACKEADGIKVCQNEQDSAVVYPLVIGAIAIFILVMALVVVLFFFIRKKL